MIKHNGEKPYQCNQCYKSFTTNTNLKFHMKRHSGDTPYNCSKCDKSFTRKIELTIHNRIHTGERPYKCNQCDMSFKQKGALKPHMGIHTEDRPYNCNQCDKSFKHNADLKIHMRKHNGIGLYDYKKYMVYNKYDKSIGKISALTVQMRNLAEEKLHNSYQCDNSLEFNDHLLQNHKMSNYSSPDDNLKSRTFACYICKVKFNNLNECRQHIKSHRDNVIPTIIEDRITCQEISKINNPRTPRIENILDTFGGQNDITGPRDQISIKVEQDIESGVKLELEDYADENVNNPLYKMMNPSEGDLQKPKMTDNKDEVSIKLEGDLVKVIIKEEPMC